METAREKMARMLKGDALLPIRAVADALSCNPQTIRRMAISGKLEIVRIGPRLIRVKASSVRKLLEQGKEA